MLMMKMVDEEDPLSFVGNGDGVDDEQEIQIQIITTDSEYKEAQEPQQQPFQLQPQPQLSETETPPTAATTSCIESIGANLLPAADAPLPPSSTSTSSAPTPSHHTHAQNGDVRHDESFNTIQEKKTIPTIAIGNVKRNPLVDIAVPKSKGAKSKPPATTTSNHQSLVEIPLPKSKLCDLFPFGGNGHFTCITMIQSALKVKSKTVQVKYSSEDVKKIGELVTQLRNEWMMKLKECLGSITTFKNKYKDWLESNVSVPACLLKGNANGGSESRVEVMEFQDEESGTVMEWMDVSPTILPQPQSPARAQRGRPRKKTPTNGTAQHGRPRTKAPTTTATILNSSNSKSTTSITTALPAPNSSKNPLATPTITHNYIKCHLCPNLYGSNPSYLQHVLAQHFKTKNSNLGSFCTKCSFCPLVFPNPEKKLHHERVIHNYKYYDAQIAVNEALYQQQKTSEHTVRASTSVPAVTSSSKKSLPNDKSCPNCRQLFSSVLLMHRHALKCAFESYEGIAENEQQQGHKYQGSGDAGRSSSSSGRNCRYCDASFQAAQPYKRLLHEQRVHGMEIPYKCPKCCIFFSNAIAKTSHMKKHIVTPSDGSENGWMLVYKCKGCAVDKSTGGSIVMEPYLLPSKSSTRKSSSRTRTRRNISKSNRLIESKDRQEQRKMEEKRQTKNKPKKKNIIILTKANANITNYCRSSRKTESHPNNNVDCCKCKYCGYKFSNLIVCRNHTEFCPTFYSTNT